MLLVSSVIQVILGLYLEYKEVEKYEKICEKNVKRYKEKHAEKEKKQLSITKTCLNG